MEIRKTGCNGYHNCASNSNVVSADQVGFGDREILNKLGGKKGTAD